MWEGAIKFIKESGGFWLSLIVVLIGLAVSYGSSTASVNAALANQSTTINNHEGRITKLEQDDKDNTKEIARVGQEVHDMYRIIVLKQKP